MQHYFGEGQDYLAHKLIGDKGCFLDIGCAEPIKKNNTYALELLGWRGICIDQNNFVAQYKKARKSQYFCLDALSIDWKVFLKNQYPNNTIDFISMDIDNANIELIQRFPFDQYEFKILCFETDFYNCGDRRKKVAEEVLGKYPQYYRLIEDATIKGLAWEDCWANEKYINLKDKAIHSIEYQNFYV